MPKIAGLAAIALIVAAVPVTAAAAPLAPPKCVHASPFAGADFGAFTNPSRAGTPVAFDGSCSKATADIGLSSVTPDYWTWDFGDGTAPVVASSGAAAAHRYATEQDAIVTLTVRDAAGSASTATARIHALGDPDCPPVVFPIPDRTVQSGTLVRVCPEATDPDDSTLTWQVDLAPGMWQQGTCIVWVPTLADQGRLAHVRVQACDRHACADTTYSVYVLRPPPDAPCPDTDLDGICDRADNCPNIGNHDQADADGDGTGDVCEVADGCATPCTATAAIRLTPPGGASDRDLDGIADREDDCPALANHDQADLDGDGLGDVCDPDVDGDGVADKLLPLGVAADNCPTVPNPDQVDTLRDGRGDACRAVPTGTVRSASVRGTPAHATTSWLLPVTLAVGAAVAALARRRAGLVVLFSRLRRSELVEHPVRARLVELVAAAPGQQSHVLAQRLGLTRSTVEYHLRVLTTAGLVARHGAGRAVVYAPPDRPVGTPLSASAMRVLAALADGPRTRRQLGSALGLSQATVRYHLKRLRRQGLVTVRTPHWSLAPGTGGPDGHVPRGRVVAARIAPRPDDFSSPGR